MISSGSGSVQPPQTINGDQLSADSTKNSNKISTIRSIVPQIIAVMVKNLLLLGYGMTLGFPTILIPAIQGGDGREGSVDSKLHLTKDEISWLSKLKIYLFT